MIPPRPVRPPRDCSLAEKLAYIRARNAWADAVTDRANREFVAGFTAGLRRPVDLTLP